MSEREKITLPEAVGFWQKNKAWLVPMIMAVVGAVGGANVDKIPLPSTPTEKALVTRVSDLEVRVSKLEGKTSSSDEIIKVEE
jgi:hypothetical protein